MHNHKLLTRFLELYFSIKSFLDMFLLGIPPLKSFLEMLFLSWLSHYFDRGSFPSLLHVATSISSCRPSHPKFWQEIRSVLHWRHHPQRTFASLTPLAAQWMHCPKRSSNPVIWKNATIRIIWIQNHLIWWEFYPETSRAQFRNP